MFSRDTTRQSRGTRTAKALLVVGFLALTGALLAGIGSPARGYELSIYADTPLAFWVGAAVAVLVGAVVALYTADSRVLRPAGFVLAGGTMFAVVALPLVRGYYFYGQGDSLSHLGFARSFESGALSPAELLHPGVHLSSLLVDGATGLSLRHGMLLAVFVFFLVFLVFVPLCVREVAKTDSALAVGLLAAMLFLPINHVATHVNAHPSSQAILFLPFGLFLLLVYLQQSPTDGYRPSGVGVVLALTTVAIVLVHPQEAMILGVIFGTVVLAQFLARRVRPGHPFASHHPLVFQTAFFAAVWLLWAPRSPRVQSRLQQTYDFVLGSVGPTPAGEATERASVLAEIGASIGELFVKLFLAALVFSLIAGVVMAVTPFGVLDDRLPDRNAPVKYLTAAFVPLLAGTGFVFLGSFGDHHFRFVGSLMVVVTIVAAAALATVAPAFRGRSRGRLLRGTVLVLFLVLLPITAMVLYPSPWIYQGTPQVTEQEVTGYATAIEQSPGEVDFAGIRGGGNRYVEAIYGPRSQQATAFTSEAIPFAVFGTNLTSYYEEPHYIPVRTVDVEREVGLYHGVRYSERGFETLHRSPAIHRVQSTGEFFLYYLADEQ